MLERIHEEIETYVILYFEFSSRSPVKLEEVRNQIDFSLPADPSSPVFEVKNLTFNFQNDLAIDHPEFLTSIENFEAPSSFKVHWWADRTGELIGVKSSPQESSGSEYAYVCGLIAYVAFEIEYEWDWDKNADGFWDEVKRPLLSSLTVDFGSLSGVRVYAGFDEMG